MNLEKSNFHKKTQFWLKFGRPQCVWGTALTIRIFLSPEHLYHLSLIFYEVGAYNQALVGEPGEVEFSQESQFWLKLGRSQGVWGTARTIRFLSRSVTRLGLTRRMKVYFPVCPVSPDIMSAVKPEWDRSEIEVTSKGHRSEIEMKLKWNRFDPPPSPHKPPRCISM